MKSNALVLLAGLFCSATQTLIAQENRTEFAYARLFDKDSLKGFDEQAVRNAAITGNYAASELGMKIALEKRRFINNKYNLGSAAPPVFHYPQSVPVIGCANSDFEDSPAGTITTSNQVQGWVITAGSHTPMVGNFTPNTCNLLGCCPLQPVESELIDAPAGYIDANIGNCYPIFSAFGATPGTQQGTSFNPHLAGGVSGTKFLRLNSNLNNLSIGKLSKTFLVSASNSLFQYAYINIQNSDHDCCESGGMQFKLINATNFFIPPPCYGDTIKTPSQFCKKTPGYTIYECGTGAFYVPFNPPPVAGLFNLWKVRSVDLSPYIGQTVIIEITVSDCIFGAHFGYCYFDAQCTPSQITFNATTYTLATNSLNLASCQQQATLTAPADFSTYQWWGPSGFTSTLSTITTSVAGVYSLALGQKLGCSGGGLQLLHLSFVSPTIAIASSNTLLCSGTQATINAGGLNSCLWNTGASTSSIVVSPLQPTTYSVSGIDGFGCNRNGSLLQQVQSCTGLETFSAGSGINLFPNPNKGEFIVTVGGKINSGKFKLETVLGQLVHEQALLTGENKIQARKLAPGIYYYSIFDGGAAVKKGKLKLEE